MRKILSATKTTTRQLSTNSKPPKFNNLSLSAISLAGFTYAHQTDTKTEGSSFCFWKYWINSSSDTEDQSANIDSTSPKKEKQNESNSNAKEIINVKEMVKHREQLVQKEASENFDIFEHTNRLNNSI